jgi:hypothetical protein
MRASVGRALIGVAVARIASHVRLSAMVGTVLSAVSSSKSTRAVEITVGPMEA